ncbi:sugar transporter [Xylariaceae sp. FL0804]|nr:sugar transporter [Xylariaceae sp. FL0804]
MPTSGSKPGAGPETPGTGTGTGAGKGTMDEVIRGARLATEKEHRMSLAEGVRLYPKAIAWSVLISTCIVMEGYDIALVNNFYAFPAWNRKYGQPYTAQDGSVDYQVPAAWQSGLSNGAVVGEIIGLMINGWVSERFGYRYTVMACLGLLVAFTAILFTAPSVAQLQAGEVLCGVPWGVFQTLTVTYAAEVCPLPLRGYLTTYINCCWGVGQLVGIGVLMGSLWRGADDQWAYRIPYALQWMLPVPLVVGILFAPESPWWLVRRERIDDARRALLRLTSAGRGGRDVAFDVDETIAMMVHTTALEDKITKGASYLDCFKGTDLRRTEIVCACWAIQNLSGNSFSNFSTYFLEQAGLSSSNAYAFACGQYAINCVGVFGAWALIALGVGRRTLYLYGLAGLFCMLLILGFLGLAPNRTEASLATGAIMLVWALFYQLTVGTVCYSLVAEISTRRLQIKTVVLGRMLYNVVGIICGVLTPYMVNPSAWNWGNYAGFFWAGSCFLCFVYTYFRVPEPSGRTFAELDLLFARRVSARRFAQTDVDVFAADLAVELEGSKALFERYQDQIAIAHMEHRAAAAGGGKKV